MEAFFTAVARPDAGTPTALTATLRDPFGNVAAGYRGTVRFSSSDAQATLPANYTFTAADNGVHAFPGGATLYVAGPQAVTATDTVAGSITGTADLTVSPGPLTYFYLWPEYQAVTAGVPADVFVFAFDAYWNVAPDYTGEVWFWTTDGAGVVPANYTFLQVSGPGVTVYDDAAVDVLSGASGSDWFFANLSGGGVYDQVFGLGGGEIVEELGVLAP